VASGSWHRFVIGVLASATLVVAPVASSKARDCKGTARQGNSLSDCAATAATPAEAAASAEEATRAADLAARAKRLAERTDYQLLYKYPDKATWGKLMVGELNVVSGHIEQAMARLNELRVKRKRLDQKAEFYKGKPLPADLQLEMDQSEAAFAASAFVFRGLEQNIAHIVEKYNRPLARLEKLWAGAPIGSMGLYVEDAAASAAK
jgi:hypothetical protein